MNRRTQLLFLCVSCIDRSPRIVRELIEECQTEYLRRIQKKTSVFEHENGEWRKVISRNIRPISMDARQGILYKRGFLWYGPPGTGKSGFRFSIAGRVELNIYVLSIPKVDDSGLNILFSQLPPHCIVLLEDVDAISTPRTETPESRGGCNSILQWRQSSCEVVIIWAS